VYRQFDGKYAAVATEGVDLYPLVDDRRLAGLAEPPQRGLVRDDVSCRDNERVQRLP